MTEQAESGTATDGSAADDGSGSARTAFDGVPVDGPAGERLAGLRRDVVEVTVDADVDTVWQAVRDRDRLRQWFGWDYDGLSAEIDQIFVDGVRADEAARTLDWPDGDRFTLEPDGDARTTLTVSRLGHTDGAVVGVHDAIDEGWITFVQQLRFYLERHRDQERRTVTALGVGLGSTDEPLLTRLGIRPMGSTAVGEAYTVDCADGHRFSGEVFFQTDLQVGLTVTEEDDALLVIARTPPTSAPPDGEAMFLLSTYGLDDARFEQTVARWTAWWGVQD